MTSTTPHRSATRPPATDTAAGEAILALLGTHRSVAPRDVAQMLATRLAGDGGPAVPWQKLLPAVRRAALALARQGRIVLLRKGWPADPDTVRGVFRLALPDTPPDQEAVAVEHVSDN